MNRSVFTRSAFAAASSAGAIQPQLVRAAETPITLRIGTIPLEATVEPLYARDLGLFEEAGLDVQMTISAGGGAPLVAAVLSRDLDVCISSVGPLILARANGIKVKYFCPASIYVGPSPNSGLLVAKGSPIRSAADMVGKTIAVPFLKDVNHFAVEAWVERSHVDSGSVHYVEMPYAAMAPSLAQGRIDAMCQPEPFLTASATSVARVLVDLDDVIAKKYYLGGWVVTDDWPQQNIEAAKRFIKVMQRTARWVNGHRTESGTMLAKYTKIDPATIAVMKRNVFDESGQMDPKLIQGVLSLMVRYGGVSPSLAAADLTWRPG